MCNGSGSICYMKLPILENTGLVKAGFSFKCEWDYFMLAEELGVMPEQIIRPFERKHTNHVQKVSSVHCGEGTTRAHKLLLDTDGIVTDEPGLVLSLIVADCAAVYFVDPIHKCIGIAHSGREGTKQNIVAATMKMLADCYGTRPQDVVVAVSPSICQDCYEVDAGTAEQYFSNLPREWWQQVAYRRGEKYYLDIAKTIYLQLQALGVNQIQISEYCTKHSDLFYSYRASGNRENQNIAWLMLKN